MPNVGIILQARMGSSRLPGKVMKPLAGKPMIQWIIERLRQVRKADKLVLATSTLEQDKPLRALAERLQVPAFAGSESDVLDRYYQCARTHALAHIVRATGDNPFVDPDECDNLIDFYFSRGLAYATISNAPEDGFPLGVGLEIFSFAALKQSWQQGQAPHHREHVNEYILESPQTFPQARMPAPRNKQAPGLSLTVDTSQQFDAAEKAYVAFLKEHPKRGVEVPWAIEYYRATATPTE